MPAHVTLGAQPRVANFQQPVVHRAVRFVTIATAFKHRRMFMQKRSAPFGMAGVTVLVDARLFELRGIRRAVGVVAIRTS